MGWSTQNNRIWKAVSSKGRIQKWSRFQLGSLFSTRPCSKVTGKKRDVSLLFLYPAFRLARQASLIYSDKALCIYSTDEYFKQTGKVARRTGGPNHRLESAMLHTRSPYWISYSVIECIHALYKRADKKGGLGWTDMHPQKPLAGLVIGNFHCNLSPPSN